MAEWREDILGPGFECLDLDLGEDEEGPLVATLVRSLPTPRSLAARLLRRERPLERLDVLYVHGWSDYFFQRDLARFFTDRGARFFALDLRKYGRSLRDGQTAGYIGDLDDYHEEIDLALDEIAADQPPGASGMLGAPGAPARRLALFGHSTGGLVLSLWASENADRFDALLLNSPWLEFQLSGAARQLIMPIVNFSARIRPREVAPQLDYGFYTRAQREVGPADELADINPIWRPEQTHAVHSGWMRAILSGHARVSRGLDIDAPVLTLLSSRSAAPLRWSDELLHADTVLDVDEVAKAALRIGSSVTVERIDGALHDVFLSSVTVRDDAYRRLERWLTGWRAADRLGS
ncbi:alpha/beta hydrolase [Leucobacter ruminantium]|uniref:Alpha/beta hydrolase n=1 Tax=Leucobacter ruminantium TaxID=1289170 RepID=A0A939LXU3_9MICO|nr:alpha/beta hydrolase [Leucobacter ruminantium]MBO1806457.1 alpha/beta hydrolase [Leucobacter ruminantium]